MGLKTMHLFAGAGGGLLADLILGHEPICAVEWDAYCCQILRERSAEGWFPGLSVWEGDVRLFDPSEYAGRVDCIAAGFPCQDISAAGGGEGITGSRSGLVSEVFRAVDVARPGIVFLENSPRIRTKGRHVVIGELVARGYAWRDGKLAAADVEAGHERDRWWCLAANADGMRQLEQEGRIADEWRWDCDESAETANVVGIGCDKGRPERNPRQRVAEASVCACSPADRLRNRLESAVQRGGLSEADAETIQAVARYVETYDWSPPDIGVCGVVDGLANRMDRIKACGNGQVPLQAAAAFSMLMGEL